MKAREGSRRFSDSKKRLAPGEVLRKLSRRRGVVCEKLSRRLQEFGKKLLGVQRVKDGGLNHVVQLKFVLPRLVLMLELLPKTLHKVQPFDIPYSLI